jgi:hypothetical protein
LRPNRTVIACASLEPGLTIWLARKSTCKQFDALELRAVKVVDVVEDWDARPMLSQDSLAKFVSLNKSNCFISATICRKGKASNSAE